METTLTYTGPMPRFTAKNVLITGASSGLGAALARAFAAEGANVVLAARDLQRLQPIAAAVRATGRRALACTCDVTSASDIASLMAVTEAEGLMPDIVVANAGFGVVGNVDDLHLDDYQRQFDTNVWGVLRILHATLPALKQRRGQFVVVGSITGHVAQPGASAYAMSKFAVRALCDSLRAELWPHDVGVTLISPGLIDTNFRRVDNRNQFHPHVHDPYPTWLRMPAERAAAQALNAIHRRRAETVITLHGKVVVFTQRHFPWLVRWLLRFGGRARPPVN